MILEIIKAIVGCVQGGAPIWFTAFIVVGIMLAKFIFS